MSIKRYILSRTMMPSMNVTTRCCQLRQHIFTMLIANLKVIDIKTKRVAILNDQQLWFITRYICQEVDYQKVTRPSYILV
jgi:hypothetical protein